jgi:hypothetical protein
LKPTIKKELLSARLKGTLSVHLIGINGLLKYPALGNNMITSRTEFVDGGEAFSYAYKLITVDKKKAKLYKENGNWYVETIDTNEQKGFTK